tara:strand:- start:203 stop:1087 length:885 start_codon:yes stop_codon:yes gene_type:complete
MKTYLEEMRLADEVTLQKEVDLRVLSLGAGVQSSTLLFKMLDEEIKPPDLAIFADTGNEPKEVYDWLERLKSKAKGKIEIITVVNDHNTGDIVKDYQSTNKKFAMLPVHVKKPDGSKFLGRRTCTYEYKIKPIRDYVREMLGGNLRGKCVEMVMGISLDEIQRAKKPNNKWSVHTYPLVHNKITRDDCIHYFKHLDFGTPPRSACIMCPYHDNKTWKHLKETSPEEFDQAIKFDDWLRNGKIDSRSKVVFNKYFEGGEMFIHKNRIPLKEATFEEPSDYQGSLFDDECEGMCGL